MPVMAIGAIAAGAASAYSANRSSKAAKQGAQAAERSNAESVRNTREMYETTREDLAPWRSTGGAALRTLEDLFVPKNKQTKSVNYSNPYPIQTFSENSGTTQNAQDPGISSLLYAKGFQNRTETSGNPNTPRYVDYPERQVSNIAPVEEPVSQDRYEEFYKSPGYQFRLSEGMRAIEHAASSRGMSRSPRTLKELNRYASDYASKEFGTYVDRLSGLANMGQNSAAQTGTIGANLAGTAQSAYANIGNANIAAGDRQAAGYIGVGRGLGSAFSYLNNNSSGAGESLSAGIDYA